MADLEQVIEDSVNDSLTSEPVADTGTVSNDAPEETVTAAPESSQVASPAGKSSDAPVEDDDEDSLFSKRYGVTGKSVTGGENRIPYSRVKKIVAKSEKEAAAKLKAELEGTYTPKLAEFETKVRDYEERLGKVAQFEHILENDPKQFLTMLSQVPAYKEFFAYIDRLSAGQGAGRPNPSPGNAGIPEGMPQPDVPQPDGSSVYSMEGLQKLLEWQAKQVEDRVQKQVTQRYAPIEQEWKTQQNMAKMAPIIQKQLEDARTWPQFTENEGEILQALKADRNISLEGAYRKVVFPKLQASRDEMRTSILAEIKARPQSTAVGGASTKPVPSVPGKRSLEEVILEQVNAKLR